MYHFKLTLETPAANLALDEQLLAAAENGQLSCDVLRLWESPQLCVVRGRSSPDAEVHIDACRRDGVPLLRRASGGATVVIGPGCLMYALALDRGRHAELRGVDTTHRFVLDRMAAALTALVAGVACAGTSDLALPAAAGEPPRKFSGNSLRVKRTHLLYHGTILYDFPLERVSRWLAAPSREPAYRAGREHGTFLANLPATRAAIERALLDVWNAHEALPRSATADLRLAAKPRAMIDPSPEP
jgi:lipoate-protein ligase A